MRGTVSGGLWGIVIGGVGLAVASQVSELPARLDQSDATPELVSEAATDDASVPLVADAGGAVEEAIAEEPTPVVEAEVLAEPESDVEVAVPDAPEALAEAPGIVAPVEEREPEITATTDEPIEPAAPSNPTPPLLAEDEPAPNLDTSPTVPLVTQPTPDVADAPIVAETATTPQVIASPQQEELATADEVPELVAPVEGPVPAAPAIAAAPVVPVAEPETDATDVLVKPTEAPTVVAQADGGGIGVSSQAPTVPALTAQEEPTIDEAARAAPVAAEAETSLEQEPAPGISQADIAEASKPEPVIVAQESAPIAEPDPAPDAPAQVADDTPTVEETVTAEVTEPATSGTRVRVNRLGAEPEIVAEPAPEEETSQSDDVAEDGPAMQRFATAFENPDNVPLLSVILLDNNAAVKDASKIAALGFPVTVVLDPLAGDAAARMAALRAAGIEVGLQAKLPNGANPADVEVTFEAAFGVVPEATLLFTDGSDGVQGSRAVTAQVMQVLASEGRGLIAVQKGLGNTLRAAAQADVPAAEIAGDLDGAGQDARAVNRALEQAAFRARQTGDAVLLARISDETLRALTDWAAGNRDDQLKLAPATAVLIGKSQ